MDYGSIMAAFSSLALGHSLFLAVYFWKRGDSHNLPNRLLALLLLALAVRITKSVIVVLFPAAPDVIPAIGLIGMAAIGPLLFLYVRSLLEADFSLSRRDALHFLLPAFLLIAIPFFSEQAIYHCYQVTVAERRLRSPEYQHLSVEAIAYDSGFNSLSAFYAAFKKLNGISPARYRKQVG